jgi:predicted nucleic acid-binding protein
VAYYLDTSAFLKLVVHERESDGLIEWAIAEGANFFASELLRVEALRTGRRHSPEAMLEVRERLDAVTLVTGSSAICDRAAELDPSILRSLDAVYLATALQLGDALQAVVTYDARLAQACAAHGVRVVAPS